VTPVLAVPRAAARGEHRQAIGPSSPTAEPKSEAPGIELGIFEVYSHFPPWVLATQTAPPLLALGPPMNSEVPSVASAAPN
jgi:hypothetical protein